MRQPPSVGRRSAALSILGLTATALGGCVVAPAYPHHPAAPGYYDGDVVTVAPPPPRYEVIGVAPYPGWFWIGGHWTWRSHRHTWVDGRWSAPRPGHRWQPHRWEPISRGGWREVPGRWH